LALFAQIKLQASEIAKPFKNRSASMYANTYNDGSLVQSFGLSFHTTEVR